MMDLAVAFFFLFSTFLGAGSTAFFYSAGSLSPNKSSSSAFFGASVFYLDYYSLPFLLFFLSFFSLPPSFYFVYYFPFSFSFSFPLTYF